MVETWAQVCDLEKQSVWKLWPQEDEEVELFEEERLEFGVVVLAKHWEGFRKSFFSTSSNASQLLALPAGEAQSEFVLSCSGRIF